jgi:hypothetical protein
MLLKYSQNACCTCRVKLAVAAVEDTGMLVQIQMVLYAAGQFVFVTFFVSEAPAAGIAVDQAYTTMMRLI